MYVDEYVGPSKLEFDEKVICIVNEWLRMFSADLVPCNREVEVRDYNNLYTRCGDLTEAVRSADLDIMLRRNFRVIEATPFGGTLLQPFFLTACLKPPRLKIKSWLESESGQKASLDLARREMALLNSKKIPADFMYYVLQKLQQKR